MNFLKATVMAVMIIIPIVSHAADENAIPAIRGYDVVSYQTLGRPVMGYGNHVAKYDGKNFLFINGENKNKFKKNPKKYAPAYGGWCAFGVSINKKFYGDPLVWEIVDGQLYVNLDNKIKGMWRKDIPGNIKKADKAWKGIKSRSAASL